MQRTRFQIRNEAIPGAADDKAAESKTAPKDIGRQKAENYINARMQNLGMKVKNAETPEGASFRKEFPKIAYDSGKETKKKGIGRDRNPFHPTRGKDEYDAWHKGYDEG
jgi:hypothetical protein